MKRMISRLPYLLIAIAVIALWLHGPIPQPPQYHDFADKRFLMGIPNGANVLSSLGFALVGVWGLFRLRPARYQIQTARGWPGYALFLISIVLTAAGSSFYHLEPDNSRLVWDRLPIALACAGLLAGVYAETRPGNHSRVATVLLAFAAVVSVAWWYVTEQIGRGDLRPYVLLQCLPLLLIPVWQAASHALSADRVAFGIAIGLYVAAKAAELHDFEVLAALGWISGHTAKHILATASAGMITGCLVWRIRRSTWGVQPLPVRASIGNLRS